MSYTEYLRRKAAASTVVLDTRQNTDASMYIFEKRLATATIFPTNGQRVGSITNTVDVTTNPQKAVRSYVKTSGGWVPDASTYTASSATHAGYHNTGRIVKRNCASCIPVLGPAPKSASDFTRQVEACPAIRGDPVSDIVFVDNTIRLSSGLPPEACCSNKGTAIAIHDVKEKKAFVHTPNRPSEAGGQYALKGVDHTPPGLFRKVGGPVRADHLPYVERHHGNDLRVNPRRIPVRYQIPANSPAHLKINDPKFGNVKY